MGCLCASTLAHVTLTLMPLKPGDPAPDFDLPAVAGEREFRVRLSDFRDRQHVVLTFHPLDWTPT